VQPDGQLLILLGRELVNLFFSLKGIGAKLSNMLFEIGREMGCKGIWLATKIDNAEARALYKKLATRQTKDIVGYDRDGVMGD